MLTEQHVKETLNGDKLMRFNELNLSDLRLTFPLPPHLASKCAYSLSLQWELTHTKKLENSRSICCIWFYKTVFKPNRCQRVKQDGFISG